MVPDNRTLEQAAHAATPKREVPVSPVPIESEDEEGCGHV